MKSSSALRYFCLSDLTFVIGSNARFATRDFVYVIPWSDGGWAVTI